jgi:hypothetical protein
MTINWVIQGGQTGVDRGAWAAAQVLAKTGLLLKCGGIMPKDFCDEHGIIPAGVREGMRPCELPGFLARTKENILLASALLVVVPDRLHPDRTPGTAATLKYAATRPGLQVMVAGKGDEAAVASWLAHLPPSVALQSSSRSPNTFLMVAGPRESLWPEGESVTVDLLVGALK